MKLLYFAWLRAHIGCAEEETDLPPGVEDVAGLLDWLRGRGGGYAEAGYEFSETICDSAIKTDTRLPAGY